jgi:AMP deaminase
VVKQRGGVYQVVLEDDPTTPAFEVPLVDEFYRDMRFMSALTSPGPVTTYAYKRMQVLEERFNLHEMLNAEREQVRAREAHTSLLYLRREG